MYHIKELLDNKAVELAETRKGNMKTLTVQEHAKHVKMILDNTYGFYSVMTQAFRDRYEGRLNRIRFLKRVELLTADVTGFTNVNEFTDKSELSGDNTAVQAAVMDMILNDYDEFVKYEEGNA